MTPCHKRLRFFFNDTATTEIYTLSLHDALPISLIALRTIGGHANKVGALSPNDVAPRSEEHTSELQSQFHLVCRLLLGKKRHRALLFNARAAASAQARAARCNMDISPARQYAGRFFFLKNPAPPMLHTFPHPALFQI